MKSNQNNPHEAYVLTDKNKTRIAAGLLFGVEQVLSGGPVLC